MRDSLRSEGEQKTEIRRWLHTGRRKQGKNRKQHGEMNVKGGVAGRGKPLATHRTSQRRLFQEYWYNTVSFKDAHEPSE